MRIAVAQTRPFKGDILRNIEGHVRFIEVAGKAQADVLVFPELSITGYEPGLAAGLATTADDVRVDILGTLSERFSMTIGVGLPTVDGSGVRITEVIFQPGRSRQAYSKRYLHADEEPYFVCGTAVAGREVGKTAVVGTEVGGTAVGGKEAAGTEAGLSAEAGFLEAGRIALAICYELSVPAHSELAYRSGAEVYLVSVAKTKSGMERAAETLADIARRYSMMVLVSNCVGRCDDFDCGGGSAVWNREGVMLARLDGTEEGILVLDTETGEVVKEEIFPYLHASK